MVIKNDWNYGFGFGVQLSDAEDMLVVSRQFGGAEIFTYGESIASCEWKPTRQEFVPGTPGSPATAGQPYIPAYCVAGYCSDVYVPTLTKICGITSIGVPDCTYFYTYTVVRQCTPAVCYPAQPYIPPSPAIPGVASQYIIDYDLGWNYDVYVATLEDFAWGINTTQVALGTAGIFVGLADTSAWGVDGYAKYALGIVFYAGQFSIYESGVPVATGLGRSADTVVTLQKVGDQVAVLRDGVVIHVSSTPFPTDYAVLGATLYKGGERVCSLDADITTPAGEIGAGGADVAIPAIGVSGYEGASYAVGDIAVPVPVVAGTLRICPLWQDWPSTAVRPM